MSTQNMGGIEMGASYKPRAKKITRPSADYSVAKTFGNENRVFSKTFKINSRSTFNVARFRKEQERK
jgi:hypothetical protein